MHALPCVPHGTAVANQRRDMLKIKVKMIKNIEFPSSSVMVVVVGAQRSNLLMAFLL